MKRTGTGLLMLFAVVLAACATAAAQAAPPARVVVFWEDGFPTADTAAPSRATLEAALPGAAFVSTKGLGDALPSAQLLVLPFGSAFPEEDWEAIAFFLERGGNLLVVGGRPFTRAAYRNDTGWQLRDYNVRFIRRLMIDQYETTPGSDGLAFETNPDMPLELARFAWKRGFSPIIRLSAVDLYKRGGSAGSIDARLDALAWGVRDGRKLAAPAIVIDHLQNGFNGGRWAFINAELTADFFSGAARVQQLAELARQGSQEFTVRPTLPLYLPGEPIQLEVSWHAAHPPSGQLTLRITTVPDAGGRLSITRPLPLTAPIVLDPPLGKGMFRIDAELLEGERVRARYHSGFWLRTETSLKRDGPRLTVDQDYFSIDGHPIAVVGTTYMSSEVQRLFFEHPNVAVWDRDLGQIADAGLNMVRTGWWTGWDKLCDENGQPYERTLRTLEAYLMTARKHGLPVQFTFFAFLPEVLGGVSPYLDPDAVRKQQMLVSTVATRFHDVPFVAWDLINEPSFGHRLWSMRPNGDPIELAQWNAWLKERYPDRAALADAWNVPASAVRGTVPLPTDAEFAARGAYTGHNALKLYDFTLFAQQSFAGWVAGMRKAIRATGSQQLVTVGQDEGGYTESLFPGFFTDAIDFTVNHSWWQNDSLLWDSLVAKQPGKAALIQETGLQRELTPDEIARRTPEQDAALFERKMATAFVGTAGAIEWLWNLNEYMTESNESPIGAVRVDATEKPEATVLRDFAKFGREIASDLRAPEAAAVVIVTSQAAQFAVNADLQLEAQRKAVRALVNYARVPGRVLAENQIEKLGAPKLVILPSAQALTEKAWQALMKYVAEGGNLLVTGPVERDEHWHVAHRAAELGAQLEPLTFRQAELRLPNQTVPVSFDQRKQGLLEALRFSDGATLKQVTRGRGRIFWAAHPVELAEGFDAAASLYGYVLTQIGLGPPFELATRLSPGVMIYPTVLQDAVLYVITSESADDAEIDLRDRASGARLRLRLPAQHAALALLSRSKGTVKAKYGF